MLLLLPPATLTEAAYARAYRACANRDQRVRQIQFVAAIGTDLDGLTRIPLLEATLRMMGAPARLAGLGQGTARLFVRFRPLRAYRLDILGSLAGTWAREGR